MKLLAPAIFVTCYVLFAALPRHRHWVGLAGAALVLILGFSGFGIGLREAFLNRPSAVTGDPGGPAVNWNVMGIFVGTLVVAELFMRSGMPAHLAELVIRYSPSARFALLAICVMTGLISMFVENVATVLLIAPVALAMTRRLGIRPVPFFIALAICSNLQGCATLIGDPPSMLLGAAGRMSFNDFFWMHGRPSVFFMVQAGTLASLPVLIWEFRKHREPVQPVKVEPIKTMVPTYLLAALIVALALSSFFDPGFSYLAGAICMVFAVIALAWDYIFHRTDVRQLVKELDWATTLFLICVFILVGALNEQGVLTTLAQWMKSLTGENLLATYALVIGVSVVISAFVDNVPFLVAMLPVVTQLNAAYGYDLSNPRAYLLLFGLLLGASLGGNISPIGASANIVAMSFLHKRGYHSGFWEFVRIGLPFTLFAVIAGALFAWFLWQ